MQVGSVCTNLCRKDWEQALSEDTLVINRIWLIVIGGVFSSFY